MQFVVVERKSAERAAFACVNITQRKAEGRNRWFVAGERDGGSRKSSAMKFLVV